MLNFCTLFDSLYLNKALVMYESLKKHCPDFHLYIFPFDETANRVLSSLKLDHVTLVPLSEFENSELLGIKATRSKGEYCWTSTPCIIEHALDKFALSHCTYVDADLCFYADPGVLLNEMGGKSVLITEHRYSPQYAHYSVSGTYCVQFLCVKNTHDGLTVLRWWRDRCLEWCFNRYEDGKFGDQKYLDDWTTRFKGVHVLQHPGGGVAPWNVQQYDITKDGWGKSWMTVKETSTRHEMVFYHFHFVKFLKDNSVDISDYQLNQPGVLSLYADYLSRINAAQAILSGFNVQRPVQPFRAQRSWLAPWHRLKRRVKGVYNVFEQNTFIERWLD